MRKHLGSEKEATVFIAELLGIDMALEFIVMVTSADHDRTLERANTCTDNQAAIKALGKGYTTSGQPCLRSAVKKLHEISLLSDVQITLCWIPAHTGVPGNEAADRVAKEAAELIGVQPNPGPHLQSTAAINREAVRLLQAKWKKQWAEETKGRHLFKLTPESKKAVLMKHNGLPKDERDRDSTSDRQNRTRPVPL